MHLNETVDDDAHCQKAFGKDAIPFLEEQGFLGPDLIAVHCVNMQEDDIETFRKYDVKVSHNPVANMILASGVAPVPEFQQANLTIGLGTDGAASSDMQDMLEVIKATPSSTNACAGTPPSSTRKQVLEMATLGGAAASAGNMTWAPSKWQEADFFL